MVMIELNLSPGTHGVFLAMKNILKEPSCKVDTILINVSTLVRNSYAKDLTLQQMREQFHTDIINGANTVTEVMGSNANIKQPTIVLYAARYFDIIPLDHRRPFTDQRKKIHTLTEEVIKNNHATKPAPHNVNNVTCLQINTIGSVAPATQLWNTIKKIKNTQTVLMLSHVPMDWYLCLRNPNKIKIIESYHGKIKTLDDFGMKLFKKPNLPLHPGIHALLGDKDYICPSINIKEKRRLYELAEEEVWEFKTNAYIRDSLRKHDFTIPFRM